MDIARLCRKLADFHGMLDLPERMREAVDIQRQQRVALVQAADVIERQREENATLRARVQELEAARNAPPASSM
jgi:BMFP domain-containing protein YqiC